MHLKFSTLQQLQNFCRTMSLINIPNSGLIFHLWVTFHIIVVPTTVAIPTTTTTTSTIHTSPNASITTAPPTTSTTNNTTIKSNLVYGLSGLIYGLPQHWTLLRSKYGIASTAEPCDCCTGTSCRLNAITVMRTFKFACFCYCSHHTMPHAATAVTKVCITYPSPDVVLTIYRKKFAKCWQI